LPPPAPYRLNACQQRGSPNLGCLAVGDQFAETSGLMAVNLTMAAE
jgi:hypothetical protein